MAIDRDAALALELDPLEVEVERGALRFFAQATGETRKEYVDVAAARTAGYRDLPVPPTYFFSLELQNPDPFGFLTAIGVDLRGVLHGEQTFEYLAPACAGDRLTLRPRIVDVVSKKGGAMELVTKETEVVDESGAVVARLGSVLVVRSLP
ncbi:MaoC family dehydratase N-terminal domain-containing protein [Nocardioides sp. CN2-186]|uniref:MaoC family dehydratase N-terminal domain-containing protein n=1 Tax=Nocardioides tweenelious TaxID=3156607 RepID=UPI0032B44734